VREWGFHRSTSRRSFAGRYNSTVSATPSRDFESRCDPLFGELASRCFHWEDLEQHPWPVAGLWPDGTIAYVNPAWSVFAHDNGGGLAVDCQWSLGANYFGAITEALQPFFADLLANAPTTQQSLAPYTHEYECSSDAEFRRFALQVFALPDRRGYMLVHSLLVASPHEAMTHLAEHPNLEHYETAEGTVKQCAHCRRIEHRTRIGRWDWVPAWIAHPPAFISHTICTLCYGFYYPGLSRRHR